MLDAAGAAFAALILSGKEGISTKAMVSKEDVAASEVMALPAGLAIRDVLGSRLFAALEPERFTYAHRAIGEYLGARWLARQSDTGRKRRRLHALFIEDDLVPASLRSESSTISNPLRSTSSSSISAISTDAASMLGSCWRRSMAWEAVGVNGFLTKPINPVRLANVLNAAVAQAD